MPAVLEILTIALPVIPLLVGLVGLIGIEPRSLTAYRRAAQTATAAVALAALALAAFAWRTGPIDRTFAGLGLYIDALSALLLVLTSTLGFVVCRYSIRYLDGAPGQTRFLGWTLLTLAAVLCLLCARNLAALVVCWCAVSVGLHRLLTFFPERPAALRAARKKFVISRIGDACLLGAVVLAWHTYGTLEIPELFRLASAGEAQSESTVVAVLLVLGAMTKSAQFPFHTWLPETMETPTPVSALMHAGIINAGGFLVIRLSPLVAQSPLALDLLLASGAVTAVVGSVVMLTQTDVKRALAYSTVSQMGFMMMQCGLGAFSAAVLHIVAHGLYKAHAFLAAGSSATWSQKTPEMPPGRAALYGVVALALSAGIVVTGATVAGVDLWTKAGGLVIATFLTAGVSLLVFRALSDSGLLLTQRALMTGLGAALVLGYFACWKLLDSALSPFLELVPPAESSAFGRVFSLAVPATVVLALFVGWTGHGLAATPLGRRLYVLALNGFHLADLVRMAFTPAGARPALSGRRAA